MALVRITLGSKDKQNAYRFGGAAAGATAGFFLGGGNPLAAAKGAAIGASMGYSLGDQAANRDQAQEDLKFARQEAEKARRDSIIKEMGAKGQADNLAYAAAMNGGKRNDAPGMVGTGMGEGTIGSNITSSGTF